MYNKDYKHDRRDPDYRKKPEDPPKFAASHPPEKPAPPAGLYYRPSGRFEARGLFGMLVISLIAAVFLGLGYGFVAAYNPLAFLNFLFTILLAAVLGAITYGGAEVGKVRSLWVTGLVGLSMGLIALYIGWAAFSHVMLSRGGASVWVWWPPSLRQAIADLAREGRTLFFHSGLMSDRATRVWWIIEAFTIVVGTAFVAWVTLQSSPFCETCHEWTKNEFEDLKLGPCSDVAGLKARLERGELVALTELGPPQNDAYTKAVLSACPKCKALGFLTLSKMIVQVTKDGKTSESATELLANLVLQGERLAALRAMRPTTPNAPR